MIAATLSISAARDRVWDAIVIGAGPAGSVASIGIARLGRRVLLVDRSEFPRHKLCGACLNGDAVAGIRELGLGTQLDQLGGVSLNELQLRSGKRELTLPLPGGVAVTRRRLDAMLVEAAIDAGAAYLPGTNLQVQPPDDAGHVRRLTTTCRDDPAVLCSKSVILATGLAADRRAGDPALAVVPKSGSRIGAGTSAPRFPDEYVAGTIHMAVGRFGYVGLTRTDGDQLNIAAALDHGAVRDSSPAAVCERILADAGFPVSREMLSGDWRGTVGLTRRRRMTASQRLFVVGDAAGYVEPFTGEGMAWAVRGGRAVAPFVKRAVEAWHPDLIAHWSRAAERLVTRRQRCCRTFARVLRYPVLVRGLLRMVAAMPSLGLAVIHRINQEDRNELLDNRTRHGSTA